MCTPQLRNQAAALQGGADPTRTAVLARNGAPPTVDPMRRQMLAFAPFSAPPRDASDVSGQRTMLAAPTGAGPDAAAGVAANVSASPSIVGKAASDHSLVPGAQRPDILAGEASKVEDPSSAPSPQAIRDAFAKIYANLPDRIRQAQSIYTPAIADPRRPLFHDGVSYREPPELRRWLSEVEKLRGPGMAYPDGVSGGSQTSGDMRAAYRTAVGYLYTLPEVKAFLDMLSTTEGTEKYGYRTKRGRAQLENLLGYGTGPGARGRYQIEPPTYQGFARERFARSDFGEVTQDVTAIAALVQDGAMEKLLKGDLIGAISRASITFSSLPLRPGVNHSGWFNYSDEAPANVRNKTKFLGDRPPAGAGKYQPIGRKFEELPNLFGARLNARRQEFANARRAWETAAPQEQRNHMPWSFISPFRWQYFGNTSFLPKR